MQVTREDFGTTRAGEPVHLWRFGDPDGVEAQLLTYGARLHSLHAPDRDGRRDDVVLGAADLAAYEADQAYLGATAGRFAGRIRDARLTVDGVERRLADNENGHSLHGGPVGFSARVWDAEEYAEGAAVGVRLSLVSEDGDQGFPGRLEVTATYTVSPDGVFRAAFGATTDATTVVNLTHHAYWRLADATVDEHVLRVAASAVAAQDPDRVPTGPLEGVGGTPFDLREPTVLGPRLHDPALGGYDHSFALDPHDAGTDVAELTHPGSGRRLRVRTSEPALVVYTTTTAPVDLRAKGGETYGVGAGVCLEAQKHPDAPHHPDFAPAWLRPGERYAAWTEYRLDTVRE